jgi:phage gpG-like protein
MTWYNFRPPGSFSTWPLRVTRSWRFVTSFADGLADYRPIWPVIEDDFYAQEKAQFQTEGSEGGEKWAALSGSSWEEVSEQGRDASGRFAKKQRVIHGGYAAWKEAHYPGKPILERTGDLVSSLTNPNDPNTVRVEGRKTLTLGSRIPYAIYHQKGTEKMPARPEIQLTEAFKRTAMHHVQTYLVQIASQSGFRTGLGPLDLSGMMGSWARGKTPGGFARKVGW